MERFIRDKYDKQNLANGVPRPAVGKQDTGSTRSSEDLPPPLPPKTGKRFGFGLRSASSALPLSTVSHETPPGTANNATRFAQAPTPIKVNKQSRVFGTSVGITEDGNEWKLVTLREMGFPDDKRNSNILKGLGGDLERAIESLVRLGEGHPDMKARTPTRAAFSDVSKRQQDNGSRLKPLPRTLSADNVTAGISIEKPQSTQVHAQQQNSLFSVSPQPLQQQSTNPFETMKLNSAPIQQPPLETMFQNMHVSQPSQPLFPHHTGGYASQQQDLQQARLQQTMTPPVPQIPQQFHSNTFPQAMSNSYNPFITYDQQNPFPQSTNPYQTQQQVSSPVNPYLSQPPANPFSSQPQQQVGYQQFQQDSMQVQSPGSYQQQQQYFGNQLPQQPQQQQYQPQSAQSFFLQQTYQDPSQQYAQPLVPQRTGRFDKSSILALYNYPELAPPPLPQNNSNNQISPEQTSPFSPARAIKPPGVGLTPGQRSVTMPVTLSSGSKNPFLLSAPPATPMSPANRQVNRESIDSGRHSPDAFASLSARFVR